MSFPTDQSPSFAATGRSRHGESLVWLSSAGLAMGLMMVTGLFLLILFNGLAAFWPKRIEVIEIADGAHVRKFAAQLVREVRHHVDAGTQGVELQLFCGNRELNGEVFRYCPRHSIRSMNRVESVLWIERTEHGPAMVEAVAVETPQGMVPAGAKGFDDALASMMEVVRSARAEMQEIECSEMRPLNYGSNGDLAESVRAGLLRRAQDRMATVRSRMDGMNFHGKTVDGTPVCYPAENLLHVFESNRASWMERVVETGRRIRCFLTEQPRNANTEGGVFPAIFGTVAITLAMCLFVTPLGVVAAIYLHEYAKRGAIMRIVRICVNNLAGVPSIVFGVFGLAFFVLFVGGVVDDILFADRMPVPTFKTPGILWASMTLALLTLPVVVVATEEALRAVPQGMREAALACGASKWQMIRRVVLPASLPGILTGMILAMARGAGEVAPLMLVGVVKYAPTLVVDGAPPFLHPERKFMHLGFHIYDLGFQSPDSEAVRPMVFATALLLILVVMTLNLAAILIRSNLKKRLAAGNF